MSRAKARFADAKDAKKKTKTKKIKAAARKETNRESDPSLHGEDGTEQRHSSSSSKVDETPLGVLLAEPHEPKQDPAPWTLKKIETLPVLQLFKHHLKDFEGGSRKPEVAKDHTRRGCCLLYKLEDPAKEVRKLWENKNLNILKNNFFGGNDLLGKDKRQLQTLKAYIILLRLFYKFVIAWQEDVREIDNLNYNDIRLLNSAITRLDTWPKAFRYASNLGKADIRQWDIEERLMTKDFQSFINSQRTREIIQMYDYIATQERPTVSVADFSAMRDYLLLRVLMTSGQRCGAASNLTLYEFGSGVWTETEGKHVFLTRTLRHKTSSGGPAKLLWEKQF